MTLLCKCMNLDDECPNAHYVITNEFPEEPRPFSIEEAIEDYRERLRRAGKEFLQQ